MPLKKKKKSIFKGTCRSDKVIWQEKRGEIIVDGEQVGIFLEQSNNQREFMITEESNLCMVGKSEGINESNFDWKT